MLIASLVIVYLWVCSTVASLVAIDTVRPLHRGDVARAIALPILLPIFLIANLVRKS